MAAPILSEISPTTGPASGGDLVRVTGSSFAERVSVSFGGAAAEVVALRVELGSSVVDVRTPPHDAGEVDVVVTNLDADGSPAPGESVTAASAYRYLLPRLAVEADLTRLVRRLLRDLKREIAENASASVSVDYDDTPGDGLNVIALSKLPSLVLSGPTLRQNRFYSTNVLREGVAQAPAGPELVRHKPPYTVDLLFTVTAASNRTAELLNLMAAVATFLNRHRFIELDRDPSDPSRGRVSWELDPDGEFRTDLSGPGDVRAFTCGLVVRGFDVDEGLPLDRGKAVEEVELLTEQRGGAEW